MVQKHYEWLVVVEGNTDVGVFKKYFDDSSHFLCNILHAGGSILKNMPMWSQKLIMTLKTDLARDMFRGVILVVDSDDNSSNPFDDYVRSDDSDIRYIGDKSNPFVDLTETYWNLDNIIGHNIIPIRGINMPFLNHGGLESELLSAYGFPTRGQPEYSVFVEIIKCATTKWGIPKNKNGTPWWTENETAKMDKFIYSALEKGFVTSKKTPALPCNPDIITRIQKAMT